MVYFLCMGRRPLKHNTLEIEMKRFKRTENRALSKKKVRQSRKTASSTAATPSLCCLAFLLLLEDLSESVPFSFPSLSIDNRTNPGLTMLRQWGFRAHQTRKPVSRFWVRIRFSVLFRGLMNTLVAWTAPTASILFS